MGLVAVMMPTKVIAQRAAVITSAAQETAVTWASICQSGAVTSADVDSSVEFRQQATIATGIAATP